MMNRDEAILRELNLYPLWVQRDTPDSAATPLAEIVAEAPKIAIPEKVVRSDASALQASQGEQVVVAKHTQERQAAESVTVKTFNKFESPITHAGTPNDSLDKLAWPELKKIVSDCRLCELRAGCSQTVFGVGDENADWLFVGEGPGADEDAQGEPFVGKAGQLLDNMLMAIKLKRGNRVYIANIVKCRPPANRVPQAEEIASCLPYLQRQIDLIQPKMIVALGKTAATTLLAEDATLGSLRGKLHDYRGIPLMVTYHPAYLLRSPSEKSKTWQDLCMANEAMQKL